MKKNSFKIYGLILLFVGLMACDNDEPADGDYTPPGIVNNISVKDTLNGGLVFTYDLPSDNDIHYVKLKYKVGEQQVERIASSFNDTIEIKGLPDTEARTYEFYAGDRSGNESEANSITASCKTPPHSLGFNNSEHRGDYGGAIIRWENESEDWVYLNVLYTDANNNELQQRFKSKLPVDSVGIGSRWSGEKSFEYYFTDRFDNRSEVKNATVTALPAKLLPREDIALIYMDGDIEGWYQGPKQPFNGNILDRVITQPNGAITDFNVPYFATIDLGRYASISKFVLKGNPQQSYAHYKADMVKEFELYGTTAEQIVTGQDPESVEWELVVPQSTHEKQYPNLSTAKNMELGTTVASISTTTKYRYLRLKLISRYTSTGWYGRYHVGSEWEFLGDYDE